MRSEVETNAHQLITESINASCKDKVNLTGDKTALNFLCKKQCYSFNKIADVL